MISNKLSPPLPASEEPARTRGQFGKRTWRLPGYGLSLSLPILVWQLLFFCSALIVSADHQLLAGAQLSHGPCVRVAELEVPVQPRVLLGCVLAHLGDGGGRQCAD